ncbi:putative secondary metabolism biosynthetic enzyme [Rhinocladiella similis]
MTPSTMRAARYHPETNTCSIDKIPVPTIKKHEILVKIASAGLCHSDLMLFDGSIPATEPVVMGHEGVGFAEEIGTDVKGFKKGDRLGFLYIKDVCFECDGCLVHNLNCRLGTAKIQGFQTDGFFAEYAAVDSRNAIILPDNLPMETSAPYFCAGITAFHGVDSCQLKPGQWIAVVGCGGLGQMGIRFAKAMGLKVVGIDINDEVLKAATESGVDIAVNSRTPDFENQIRDRTGGGADAAVVFSAAQAAYDSATKILRIGGILMVIGLPPKPLQFSALDLMKKLYQIRSESTGPPQQMPRALEFIAKHEIKPRVDTYKLDQFHEMIDLMQSGKSKSRMAVVF